MIKLTQILPEAGERELTLSLPIDQRIKSRQRVTLSDGQEAGLFLPRGRILRNGDLLKGDCGTEVMIVAAPEQVSTVKCEDPHLLARICYHLGNRHVPLQIADGWARYQHDHVLDDMVRGLGGEVVSEQAPFEPEAGAYGGHSHGHSHSHSEHDHEHSHSHGDGHHHHHH